MVLLPATIPLIYYLKKKKKGVARNWGKFEVYGYFK